jgi:uncharacterized protein
MTPSQNQQLMQDIFSELSKGNLMPFIAAMSEDVQWTWMGTMTWSRTFKGKTSVVDELWSAVRSTLREPFMVVAERFIAQGDHVVVESRGQNSTRDGRTYNNKYCWVCRIVDGRIEEVHEYMDTELVTATFGVDGQS